MHVILHARNGMETRLSDSITLRIISTEEITKICVVLLEDVMVYGKKVQY